MKKLSRIRKIKGTGVSCLIILTVLTVLFNGCGSKKQTQPLQPINIDYTQQRTVTLEDAKGQETVKLSELIENLDIIRMENSSDALFKKDWAYFSDNYIVVKDGSSDPRPAKIFTKQGKYIASIGGIGRGPGEYQTVYDILIDEKGHTLYLTQLSSQVINQYDLKGNFIKEIKLGTQMSKPKLYHDGDSTLSVVNICFNDQNEGFIAASVNLSTDKCNLFICPELGVNFINEEGAATGFDNEIFSYRNTANNSFKYSFRNNLFRYDPVNNKIFSVLDFSMPDNMKEDYWCVYNELQDRYLIHIIGPQGNNLSVSKNDWTVKEIKFVNDLFGGMDTGLSFQDGYYFQIYEPKKLKATVDKYLKSNNPDEETTQYLTHLIDSLDDDDNNILMRGKIK